MTAGDGPAAMVLDLAVKPTINLSAVRGHMATALHDLGEDHLYDVALVVTELALRQRSASPGTRCRPIWTVMLWGTHAGDSAAGTGSQHMYSLGRSNGDLGVPLQRPCREADHRTPPLRRSSPVDHHPVGHYVVAG